MFVVKSWLRKRTWTSEGIVSFTKEKVDKEVPKRKGEGDSIRIGRRLYGIKGINACGHE